MPREGSWADRIIAGAGTHWLKGAHCFSRREKTMIMGGQWPGEEWIGGAWRLGVEASPKQRWSNSGLGRDGCGRRLGRTFRAQERFPVEIQRKLGAGVFW